jgi:hypothetical protein
MSEQAERTGAMTPEERAQAKRDQIEFLLIREGVSLLVMCAVLLLMSPQTRMWIGRQRQRLQKRRTAARVYEAKMVAQLQRELSRDLPAVERGLVDP